MYMNASNPLLVVWLLMAFAIPPALPQDGAAPAQPDPPAISPGTPAPATEIPATPPGQEPIDKRVFGVLPNYRTANETAVYTPISSKIKLIIATKDSTDYPLFLLSGALAGLGQLTDQNPSFGQGLKGYAHRLGTGYADQIIGNMMSEGFFPIMLHEDPRYFRRGRGSVKSRMWYAATRVFVTRTDSGGTRFNFSEIVGNATAVAISNAYYPDQRDARDNVYKWAEQVGIDSFSQILKEFWPDVKRRFFKRHAAEADPGLAR